MASRIEHFMSARPQELGVALGIIAILVVMVIPIPTFMLDLLLSFSITFSLIILLVSFFMLPRDAIPWYRRAVGKTPSGYQPYENRIPVRPLTTTLPPFHTAMPALEVLLSLPAR